MRKTSPWARPCRRPADGGWKADAAHRAAKGQASDAACLLRQGLEDRRVRNEFPRRTMALLEVARESASSRTSLYGLVDRMTTASARDSVLFFRRHGRSPPALEAPAFERDDATPIARVVRREQTDPEAIAGRGRLELLWRWDEPGATPARRIGQAAREDRARAHTRPR